MGQIRHLDEWATGALADPVSKEPVEPSFFKSKNGVLDARVLLKNTYGYAEWAAGQEAYEAHGEPVGAELDRDVASFKEQIERDRPVYDRFPMHGDVLDVGGLVGTVREFLQHGVRFLSVDPFIEALDRTPKAKRIAYTCLERPLNFVGAVAEFLPIRSRTVDWVHMRSMLDHVQVPDLALIEAWRVLRPGGSLLVGMYVEGGKSGRKAPVRALKDGIKGALEMVGIDRYKDHHTWHPTYENLQKLIESNGFRIVDSFWQPAWNDQVVYVSAQKR